MDRKEKLLLAATLVSLALFQSEPIKAKSKTTQARAEAPVEWSSIIAKTICPPSYVQGSDNKWNLVYELVLSNYSSKPVKIEQIEVLKSFPQNTTVMKLKGKKLRSIISCVKSPHNRAKLEPGESAIAWMNLEFKTKPQANTKLVHKIKLSKEKKKSTELIPLALSSESPLVIGAPLMGSHWLAMGGYSGILGHRKALMPIGNRLVLSQRYAIDWIKFDNKWHSWRGSWDNEKNSVCYGEPMLAVADGVIVGALDKFEDQPPFKEGKDMAYPGGNCITLKMNNGFYAFYAHIKPGSLKVSRGEKVKKGQVLAMVGNSGHSFEPHLHFHITDKPEILKGRGIAYVIDSFNLEGTAKKLKRYGTNKPRSQPAPVKLLKSTVKKSKQLPKEGAIITFNNMTQ